MDPLTPKLIKTNKLIKGKDNKLDRSLNDFPDDILKRIVSLLETRIAVQTSVLSKRWQYLWTSGPNLDFQEHKKAGLKYRDRLDFMDFVDRVLGFHGDASVQKFTLSCTVQFIDYSRIKRWISEAVMHNAQELNINLDTYISVGDIDVDAIFPNCLFRSEVIKVLKIGIPFGVLQLPSKVDLPSLKVLTLQKVAFKDHHPTNILFSSPALEELIIENCKWAGQRYEIIISAPELHSVTIDESEEDSSMIELILNTVIISAPKLKIFNYIGGFMKRYRFPNASSIDNATLNFQGLTCYNEIHTGHFGEVLSSLQLVRVLQLSTSFVMEMSSMIVPVFENLTSLEISMKPVNLSCKGVKVLLNKCPRLETLEFPMGIYGYRGLFESSFASLLSTLKSITFGNYSGEFTEKPVVYFLLANAISLETMKIFCKEYGESARNSIESFLYSIPRASKSCKLELYFLV